MPFFNGGGGAAGIGGSTGATDNAVLRADGTGAATLQNSDLNIDDASTSTQNNLAITNQHSGQTNSALVLTPKGTGAFIAGAKPDGTSTGGDARGSRAVDLQISRSNANQVASGTNAGVLSGASNRADREGAVVCGGELNRANGFWSAVLSGYSNLISGAIDQGTVIGGFANQVTAARGVTIAGQDGLADRRNMAVLVSGSSTPFDSANGSNQAVCMILRGITTTNSAVELFLGTAASAERISVRSGWVMSMLVTVTGIRSTGADVAHYVRQYCVKNVAGTTSEVYAPVTIGTDNAAGTSIALSANDTNDAFQVSCTGVASQTWRWIARVDAVELKYGS